MKYRDEIVHEDPPVFDNRLERLKAWRDLTILYETAHLENEIRAELANKYAKIILAMKIRSNLTPCSFPK